MNLPNTLTIVRIFFVPLLVAALVQENYFVTLGSVRITNDWLALAIFLAAAVTDLIDGYLARRWRQVTTIGTLLDPIADKMLVSSALIALVQVRVLPAWMCILIVGREFAVSGLRSIAAAEGYTIKASDMGKTKMLAQVAAISAMMVSIRHSAMWHPIAMALMWIVVFFSVLSALSYFRKFWRKIDEHVKKRRRKELLHLERKRQRALMRERQGGMPRDTAREMPLQRPSGGVEGLGGATIWKPPEVN